MNRRPQPTTEEPPFPRSGRFAEHWLKPLFLMPLSFPKVHTPCTTKRTGPTARELQKTLEGCIDPIKTVESPPTPHIPFQLSALTRMQPRTSPQPDRIHETLTHSYRKSYPHLSHKTHELQGGEHRCEGHLQTLKPSPPQDPAPKHQQQPQTTSHNAHPKPQQKQTTPVPPPPNSETLKSSTSKNIDLPPRHTTPHLITSIYHKNKETNEKTNTDIRKQRRVPHLKP